MVREVLRSPDPTAAHKPETGGRWGSGEGFVGESTYVFYFIIPDNRLQTYFCLFKYVFFDK